MIFTTFANLFKDLFIVKVPYLITFRKLKLLFYFYITDIFEITKYLNKDATKYFTK